MSGDAPFCLPTGGERSHALTAVAIAEAVGGTLLGDSEVLVTGVAPLDRAEPHHLTFLADAKFTTLFASRENTAGVVLLPPDLASSKGRALARVVVDRPYDAMLSLLAMLYPPPVHVAGIHPTSVIARGVRLARSVAIGPYVVLGEGVSIGTGSRLDAHVVVGAGVVIGEDCHLYPHVTLYSGTSLGARVQIHAGTRVGSDGFGYVFGDGVHDKIPHVGRCVIESDVEIGANTTIDRGSIDDTVVGAGTKIDNLVQIAHNVRIGRFCLLVSQVGVAGSVRIEDGCVLAGQVGISGHRTIGRGARLAAQAGVFGNVPPGETWSGYPARPHRETLRAQAAMFRLPSLIRRLERLLGSLPPETSL